MPKGDRVIGKADPEDGTTPVANLLLEALAMAHLSGEEKGAVLYLWRQTYGWVDGKGIQPLPETYSCDIHDDPNRPAICQKFKGQKIMKNARIYVPPGCSFRREP